MERPDNDRSLEMDPIGISTDPTSDNLVKNDKESETRTSGIIPIRELHSGSLKFSRTRKTFRPHDQPKLRNSLLAAVGFLELANAGDFAANVWNEIPVPIHAAVLMGIGGTLALGISCFAVKDALLSWANFCGLRTERHLLQVQRKSLQENHKDMRRAIDSLLDLNFREMGTELVDRIGMDICMGFGAVVVGVGTYMAIAGADPAVFQASNLLSGYIGNTPCALYGFVNLLWSVFVWRRAQRHRRAGSARPGTHHVEKMLKMRTSTFQLHASLNGITGVVAGAASLVTATMWWGYVALVPCIVLSVLTNLLWRHRVGYDRPFVHQVTLFDEDDILTELMDINTTQQRAIVDTSDPLSHLVSDSASIQCVMEFITRNQLFEEFCLEVLSEKELAAQIFDLSNETITIKPVDLVSPDNKALEGQLLQIARKWMTKSGLKGFVNRERYLLELFGCYLCHGEK